MTEALKKVEQMLQDARAKRTWGTIEISLKDGHAYLLKQTTQTKIEEESPSSAYRK